MLLFIVRIRIRALIWNWISIHLMLLFIKMIKRNPPKETNFNTSHVTVYPMMQQLLRLPQKNFNTSHVTVYLSCPVVPMMVSFDFNTSHVTVYRRLWRIPCSDCSHFNTSHVTVYRSVEGEKIVLFFISIHLMLLFIVNNSWSCIDDFHFNTSHVTVYRSLTTFRSHQLQFQYISCYCLSKCFPPFSIFLFPTNPLYLRFFSFLPSILLESFLYSIITYISLIFKLF